MFHYTQICSINLHHFIKIQIQLATILILIWILRKICHFKKASYLRQFKGQTSHFFQNPKELEDLIDKGNLTHRFLPKQTDIDKILQIIQGKVLKGTHLPVEGQRDSSRIFIQPLP